MTTERPDGVYYNQPKVQCATCLGAKGRSMEEFVVAMGFSLMRAPHDQWKATRDTQPVT